MDNDSMYEVEIKFALPEPEIFEQQLKTLGGKFGSPVEEYDVFFQHPSRDFAQTDECLRLRRRVLPDNSVERSLTYKGPKVDKTTKTRKEIEIPTESGAPWEDLLSALGFFPKEKVYKQRRSGSVLFQGETIGVMIDHLPDLVTNGSNGMFTELETVAEDETLEVKKNLLLALARQLGLRNSIQRSYLALLKLAGNVGVSPR